MAWTCITTYTGNEFKNKLINVVLIIIKNNFSANQRLCERKHILMKQCTYQFVLNSYANIFIY